MKRIALFGLGMLLAAPSLAQPKGTAPVVIARVDGQEAVPVVSSEEMARLLASELEAARVRSGKGVRLEATRFERRPEGFDLVVDAQYADDNDLLMSLPLQRVRYGDQVLLVYRPRRR